MTRLDLVEDSTQSVWNLWRTPKKFCSRMKTILYNENIVEGKPYINR